MNGLTIGLTIFSLTFFFVTSVFQSYQKLLWLVLWNGITFFAGGFYWLIQNSAKGGFILPFWLREALIHTIIFLLLIQITLFAGGLLWLLLGALKKYGEKHHQDWLPRVKQCGIVLLLLTFFIAGLGAYRMEDWKIVEIEIASDTIPIELNGLKIAQLSDPHLFYDEERQQMELQLLALIERKPDLFLFTGDIADNPAQIGPAIEILKKYESYFPLGAYGILGNHEYSTSIPITLESYAKHQLTLLRNQGLELNYKGASLYLAGVDYPWPNHNPVKVGGGISTTKEAEEENLQNSLSQRNQPAYTILASHHPDIFDIGDKYDINLTISGHTHASQLGFNRKSLNPFMQYSWGLYEKLGQYLYVSAGSGEWFPVRYGAPQEVVLITLKSTQKN